jgi:MoaA/NifB/PqqE/SkfB family radical SAM enzyme
MKIPQIYQVEVTNACNAKCERCPRIRAVKNRGGIQNLNIENLKDWIVDGVFDNTSFVELQMSGEPLLYKNIGEVIRLLKNKAGVKVGFSTNGQFLKEKAIDLIGLSWLTVSVDATTSEEQARLRPGTNLAKIVEGIQEVVRLKKMGYGPEHLNIFTVAGTDETHQQVKNREIKIRRMFQHGIDSITSIKDTYDNDKAKKGCDDMCTTPWESVSIQADGTVVSCCYVWDRNEPNVYGNLNDNSLKKIWANEKVKTLRESIRDKKYIGRCQCCYTRSPHQLHVEMLSKLQKGK